MGPEETSKVCHHFHQAIELIGRRWTGAILYALGQSPRRFSEFREAIPELSDRLLTERLRELEEAGILGRDVSEGRPSHAIYYRLTPKGEALKPVLDAVGQWAYRWKTQAGDGTGPAGLSRP